MSQPSTSVSAAQRELLGRLRALDAEGDTLSLSSILADVQSVRAEARLLAALDDLRNKGYVETGGEADAEEYRLTAVGTHAADRP